MSSGTGMSAALLLFFYIFPNPAHHLARAAAVWGAFLWAPCNPWCIGITTAFSGTNLCTPCNPWGYRYACAHHMALRFLHAFKNVPQFHGNNHAVYLFLFPRLFFLQKFHNCHS